MTRMHSKTQKRTKSETTLMWKSHSVDWKSYISTCMLTMHPLNILNMWPIIYKLIVAGAGPVHSCMCNRLLIQWQTFEILTMSSSIVNQSIQSLRPDRPRSYTYLVCWHVSRFSPIALFNRVASLNSLLNSCFNGTCILLEWLYNINQFKKKRKKKSTFLHEQHYLKYERWYHRYQ